MLFAKARALLRAVAGAGRMRFASILTFILGATLIADAAACQTDPSIRPPVPGRHPWVQSYSPYPIVLSSPDGADLETYYTYTAASPAVIVLYDQGPDCRPTTAQGKVTTAPAHGKLLFEHGKLPSLASHDVLSFCDARSRDPFWVRYLPAPGFSGLDHAIVQLSDGPNRRINVKIWIKVESKSVR